MTKSNDNETFITHLEALRKTLLHCVLAVIITLPIGLLLANKFIETLSNWTLPSKLIKLNYFSPMEVFTVQLKVGLVIAFILSFPYISKKIWGFILPALHQNERKFIMTTIWVSTFLFILGVIFCVYFILPITIRFAISFTTPYLQPVLGLSNFLGLAGSLMLSFGIMFQFPLVVLALVYFKIISINSLEEKRPYVIVFILILAAIFSPPDVVSQLFVGIPTYLLFEIGLLITKKIGPK